MATGGPPSPAYMDHSNYPIEPIDSLTLDLFGPSETVHQWERLSECDKFVGPSRSKHTMVAYKGGIYVFGGDEGKNMLYDVLRFDIEDKSWSRAFTKGLPPAPRYHHSAVVYDKSMFVFGGYTGDLHSNSNLTNKNDLFEYKFASGQWKENIYEGICPVPRAAHGAAIYRNELWIFGGYDGNARLNDLWCTDLSSSAPREWVQVEQNGDIPPTCCNFALAIALDSMYLFSGQSGAKITNDLFQFQFFNKMWSRISTHHILRSTLPPPEKRFGHTMIAFNRHLYVFGGATGQTLPSASELYAYDLDMQTWKVVSSVDDSQIPSARLFHAATLVNNAMYVFGGAGEATKHSAEMYRFRFSVFPRCTLHDDLERFLGSSKFYDVCFIVGEEKAEVFAHQAIIAARCEHLRDLILGARTLGRRNDSGVLLVRVVDADPLGFRLLLLYVYTDKIKPQLSGDRFHENETDSLMVLMKVCQLAIKFKMPRLELLCIQFIEATICHKNVLLVLHEASRLELGYLKEFCLKFIVKDCNLNHIVMSEEFECLQKPLMVEIIRRKIVPTLRALPEVSCTEICEMSLEHDLEQLMNNKQFSDIILKLGQHKIYAHKAILAARSSYFEAMFRWHPAPEISLKDDPDELEVIEIGETIPSLQAFRSLLKFIYYGCVEMPPEDSLYLFSAPDFFYFTNNRLQAYCKHNLESNINYENVLEIFRAADHIESLEIKQYALNIIVHNIKKVTRLTGFQTLTKELLLDVCHAIADANPPYTDI